ncbi:MAG: zf-HC2 domain-containing protein [Bryobacterales bacterium]|nr:zf-HC2 domain-containing protein [Bryobacterales bacterium]MDE0628166.1 zf-HC2 domain-containing protein [Bryobacterales bacterium]
MHCNWARDRIERYVSNDLGPIERALLRFHLTRCPPCLERYESRETVALEVAALPPRLPSRDLEVRILSAVSLERLRRSQPRMRWNRTKIKLGNLVRPVAVPAAGGLLVALLLVPALLSAFWTEPVVHANDIPLRILAAPVVKAPVMTLPSPYPVSRDLIVLAYIDHRGGVYDYKVASSEPLDQRMRGQLANALLTSKFEPAQRFGQPIRGQRVILYQRVDSHA